jgi:hypothetical protein
MAIQCAYSYSKVAEGAFCYILMATNRNQHLKTSLETPSEAQRRKLPLALVAVAAGIVVAGLAWTTWQYQTRNYAKEVASPLEKSLMAVDAVKKCSRDDPGRGTDNNRPWYYAVYEVPGGRQEATGLVRTAAKQAGYTLKDGPEPVNPEDNKFYSDKTSKQNAYPQLRDGNIDLSVDVYGSSTYTGEGDQFCTVTRRDNPPTDKTTIRFTIGLPEFKR